MLVKREVSNREVVEAFAVKDNRSVVKSVFERRGVEDRGDSHALAVVWKTLRCHQAGRQKLTNSLYWFAEWEAGQVNRERKRQERIPVSPIEGMDFFCGSEQEKQEDSIFLGECMEMLPEKEREVITLHFERGMTFREIAELQGCVRDTARNRVGRAVAHLRRICFSKLR